MGDGSWHRVDPADVPAEGRVRSATVDGRTVALARCGVRLGALQNRCPHLVLQHLCPQAWAGAAQPACRQPQWSPRPEPSWAGTAAWQALIRSLRNHHVPDVRAAALEIAMAPE